MIDHSCDEAQGLPAPLLQGAVVLQPTPRPIPTEAHVIAHKLRQAAEYAARRRGGRPIATALQELAAGVEGAPRLSAVELAHLFVVILKGTLPRRVETPDDAVIPARQVEV